MSGNSIPDANIPMAWALNDSGIPIAVAVDTYEMPIAVVVDPAPQNIQITELERINAQMAERAQAQERALQEEKIKQQKQQQELQKAQQQLIQVQKEQEIENQFNLTQMRLIDEYTNRISLAAEYRQLGNFDRAIQQYEMSIDSINRLRNEYKNKENSLQQLFGNHEYFKNDRYRSLVTPKSYSNYIFQSRLEIANCLISKGDLEQAYDALQNLRYTGDSHILEARIKECHDIIYKHAQKLISEVAKMSTRGNIQQIAKAQSLINDAEKLLKKINQTNDSNFLLQKVRLEWDSIRDHINRECHDLLNTKLELEHYEAAVQRARKVVAAYANHASLLDSQELSYQSDLVKMLPSFEQVAAQLKINDLRNTAEKCLSIGDIPRAYIAMHEIYNLAIQIKNPSYIEQNGLIYHHPQVYYWQLQNLESEVQKFKLRSKEQHNPIVEQIIVTALKKLSERTPNASLFENDLKELRATLSQTIQQEWYKFDHRPEPRDLINNIAEQIAANCEDIGFFKKWFNWSYATSCLKDTSKTLVAVKQQVCDYIPTIKPNHVVTKGNGPQI